MPTVFHPRALDAVDGHPPSAVTVSGANYRVGADGLVDLPDESHVRELARAYGLSPEDLSATDESDGCPHCDEYDGDHVEQHVAQAHPDAE
jgi:hypothetical protein